MFSNISNVFAINSSISNKDFYDCNNNYKFDINNYIFNNAEHLHYEIFSNISIGNHIVNIYGENCNTNE